MSAGTPVRTFRLDEEHWRKLTDYAAVQDITASDALRQAIDLLPPAE